MTVRKVVGLIFLRYLGDEGTGGFGCGFFFLWGCFGFFVVWVVFWEGKVVCVCVLLLWLVFDM